MPLPTPPRPSVAEVFSTTRQRPVPPPVGRRVSSPLVRELSATHPVNEVAGLLRARALEHGTPLVEAVPGDPFPGAGGEVILTFLRYAPQAREVALVTFSAPRPDTLTNSLFEPVGEGMWQLALQVPSGWRGSYAIAVVESEGAMAQTSQRLHALQEPVDPDALRRAQTQETYRQRRLARAMEGLEGEGRETVRRWFDIQGYAAADPWAREQLHSRISIASGPDVPVAVDAPVAVDTGAGAPARPGTLHTLWVPGRHGQDEQVSVHIPALAHPPDCWPVLVLLDGHDWLAAGIASILDALADRSVPVLTVLVGHSDDPHRVADLMCEPAFVDHLDQVVLPAVEQRWPLAEDPEATAIAGQSLGGLTALYAQARAPHRFGVTIAQSGAFWWPVDDPEDERGQWLTRVIEQADLQLGTVWLEAGLREPSQAEVNRRLAKVLRGRARALFHREFDGGHDRACWRSGLAQALLDIAHARTPATQDPTVG